MAEAIAVVGVIASFIQLTDFGFRVAHRLKDFTSQTKDVPESLRHVATELPALLVALKRSAQALAVDNIADETRKALEAPIKECAAEIESLLKILLKIQPKAGQTTKKRIWKGIWSLRYDARIRNKMAVIRGYAQTLSYYHVSFLSPENSVPIKTLPKPLPSSTVPYHRNLDFVDTGILQKIEQKLTKPASRVALFGQGGIGKTQLALEYAHMVRENFPKTWVFWIDAATLTRFEEGYRKIAEASKPLGWDDPKSNTMELVKAWLCDERNGQWLIILDNADEPTIFSPDEIGAAGDISTSGQQSLSDMIPQSHNGSVLVTSQNLNLASKLKSRNCEILEVGPMDQEFAKLLVARKLNPRVESNEEATRLEKLLQYHPLALSQAAAYLRQNPQVPVTDYIEKLEEINDGRDIFLSESTQDAAFATYMIAIKQIQQEDQLAADSMCLLAIKGILDTFLKENYPTLLEAHRTVGASLAEDIGSDDKFDKAISILMAYSLVAMNTRGELEMHPLVHAWTKKLLEVDDSFERWKSKYIDFMHQTFVEDDNIICQDLLPHVEAILEYQPSGGSQSLSWAYVVFRAAEFCRRSGRDRDARKFHRLAFGLRRKELGENDPVIGQSLDRLRQCEEAEAPDSQALELVQTLRLQAKSLRKKLLFFQYTLLFVAFAGFVFVKRLLVI